MTDLYQVKALAFDVGGTLTLIDWFNGTSNQLTEFGKRKGSEAN